ncbi:hypothetical protein [Bradyrhizobium sp.]|jgi:hypothetical protein|uniref:hypothetical protein n=1 Tax=Bradyrhizobium sp. TaxID=376 RepID=UPI003BAF6F79
MKSNHVGMARFSFLSAPWWGALRAAAIAMLLGLPLGSDAAHAAPATSGAHVYLVRGVLNIFSLGMDQIAARLQQQGINATVHNHLAWASIADDAAAEYKSGRAKTIILVGHSSGATSLPDIVARMDQQGVPVKLAIGLDSVFHTSLAGRVGRYINFYVANGAGTRVEKTGNFRGTLENVDVERVPGVSHLSIDKNEIMQQKVIAAIDAAVFSAPGGAPSENKPQAGPRTAPQAASAKRAAAAN